MTRGNLSIVIVLILALVGMFFWTLSLHNQQSELLGSGGISPSGDGGVENAASIERLERQVRNLNGVHQASQVELSTLASRLDELEGAGAVRDQKIAALASGGVVAAGAEPGDGSLRAAIEDVMAQRQAKEQRERLERMARNWSRYLLADVDATQEQTDQFVKIVASYMDNREKVRAKYRGREADIQARDGELRSLDEDRNAKLLTVFDTAQYSKIEERLNRGRGFIDGSRSNRGGRGMGGPGRGR